MLRRPEPPALPLATRPRVASLADLLEPDGSDELPTRVGLVAGTRPGTTTKVAERTPAGDMAFADTVVADDLPDVAPSSTPFIVNDGTVNTPLAFPLATRLPDESLWASIRAFPRRFRRDVRVAVGEIFDAWRDTAAQAGSFTPPVTFLGVQPPEVLRALVARIAFTLVRLRALLSAWDWSVSDVLRACAIGAVVFAVAAFAGVATLTQAPASAAATADGAPSRSPHAVASDHTALGARYRVVRSKIGR